MNRSDIEESIQKGLILHLNKEILVKRILTEEERNILASENESLKAIWNIQIDWFHTTLYTRVIYRWATDNLGLYTVESGKRSGAVVLPDHV